MSISNLLESPLPERDIARAGLLRLLMEGMKNIDGVSDFGNVERPVLAVNTDTHLADASTNGFHRLPVAWVKSVLNT
jgi:hypothetical protein